MNSPQRTAPLALAGFVITRLLFGLSLLSPAVQALAEPPATEVMARWIAQMKADSRGPFDGIFWFCKDGAVLPPQPYACSSRGGGIQHGRLSERSRMLREAGFPVGNVLAASDPAALVAEAGQAELKAILLERFLVAEDNGWILREARYYRGAFQIEDEIAAAQAILGELAERAENARDFPLLRQAAQLLPWLSEGVSVTRVHELSSSLATLDEGFVSLRNKIHGQPDATDAKRVRDYAQKHQRTEAEFEQLAQALEQLFAPSDLAVLLDRFAERLGNHPLAEQLTRSEEELSKTLAPAHRFATQAALLKALRDAMPGLRPAQRVQALRLSLAVEAATFATGLGLANDKLRRSPADRLAWLGSAATALYGVGLLTAREHQSVQEAIARLTPSSLSLEDYRAELNYLARVPAWAGRELAFYFGETVSQFARIEPLADQFVPGRLRASPLLIYSSVLDELLVEANGLAGIQHEMFGKAVGAGLRALNPGLARGILRFDAAEPMPDGIYLLPETTASLPPVAGILTQEAGNLLSHVQLLAGNLGIPNVVVDAALMPRLRSMAGRKVVLAVSPGGRVLIAEDGPQWERVFGAQERAPTRIQPKLAKLDLSRRDPVALGDLRAADSGRIAGPKAARLGELKFHYPEAVADGLVIPFGAFRAFLDQPMPGTGTSAYEWMQSEYRRMAKLPHQQREREARQLRERLRNWIETTDPGEEFRATLAQAMRTRFGENGRYAVFVRSDTNVEDLPGFTGAGLNLTVPNVVGLDQVVAAILRVWASPFSERAFAWRQMRMDAPEHVYVSILLQRSVPVEKSGVMLTQDVINGRSDAYTVAVNEGVGGAVSGQAAEELVISANGSVRLLAEASSPRQRVLGANGGLEVRPVSGGPVLAVDEIEQLRRLGQSLPERFPQSDETGRMVPADVEFGFVRGRLALFQIRPYIESQAARRDRFLLELDAPLRAGSQRLVYPREGK